MDPKTLPQTVQQFMPAPMPQQPVQLPSGQWVYATVPAPQPVVMTLPEREPALSPEMMRLIIITFLILAVVTVCAGAICAVIVIAGGTILGIIGTVGQNLPFIGVSLVGVIVAAGWAAGRIKGLVPKKGGE